MNPFDLTGCRVTRDDAPGVWLVLAVSKTPEGLALTLAHEVTNARAEGVSPERCTGTPFELAPSPAHRALYAALRGGALTSPPPGVEAPADG
jgi:hypothetical protein